MRRKPALLEVVESVEELDPSNSPGLWRTFLGAPEG